MYIYTNTTCTLPQHAWPAWLNWLFNVHAKGEWCDALSFCLKTENGVKSKRVATCINSLVDVYSK